MKISDVADIINVSVKDPSKSGVDVFVGLEHYDIAEPMIKRYGSTKMLSTAAKKFEAGDVLIARRNVYLHRASVARFAGLTSGDSIVLRVKKNLNSKFTDYDTICQLFPFILNSISFWDYANTNSDGTMSKRLSPTLLLDYEFDLPSLEEQKVLADKLWAAYEVKQSYLKMIEATQEMVKSQFIEMMSHRCTTKKKVGEVADVMTGSTPSRNHPEYWEGSKCWVAAQDMGCKYVVDTKEKLTDEGYATCKIVPAGSVLYVCRGSIGVISINTMDCATNQSICTATCKDGYENEFLYYALKFAENDIKKQGTGTSFKSLNQSSFSAIELNFPSSEDQKSFVSIAHQADKSEFELKKSIEAIDKVIKSFINEKL